MPTSFCRVAGAAARKRLELFLGQAGPAGKSWGRNWRMGIDPSELNNPRVERPLPLRPPPDLCMSQVMMMLATVMAIPSRLMIAAGIIHILLLLQWEARREEKHLRGGAWAAVWETIAQPWSADSFTAITVSACDSRRSRICRRKWKLSRSTAGRRYAMLAIIRRAYPDDARFIAGMKGLPEQWRRATYPKKAWKFQHGRWQAVLTDESAMFWPLSPLQLARGSSEAGLKKPASAPPTGRVGVRGPHSNRAPLCWRMSMYAALRFAG